MAGSLEKVGQVDVWAALGLTEAVLLLVVSPVPFGDPGTLTFLWELPSHEVSFVVSQEDGRSRGCRKNHSQKGERGRVLRRQEVDGT